MLLMQCCVVSTTAAKCNDTDEPSADRKAHSVFTQQQMEVALKSERERERENESRPIKRGRRQSVNGHREAAAKVKEQSTRQLSPSSCSFGDQDSVCVLRRPELEGKAVFAAFSKLR